MMIKSSLLALLLGACMVNAHMIMLTPKPFQKYSGSSAGPNSSPMVDGGSDFPCKSPTYDDADNNEMGIGEEQELSFKGSATHGGGSCQISVTEDLKPTQNTKWKVIHSIEGGCPSSASGNLGNDPNSTGATKFKFKIPEGIANGKYTLAWTWFNKIGNREMYMNCARVTVKGGSASSATNSTESATNSTKIAKRASFPPMFVANINGCITKESFDVKFPNPGSSVAKGKSAALSQGKACTGAAKFGGDGLTEGSSDDTGGDTGTGSETTSSATPPASTTAPASGSDPTPCSSAPADPASTSAPASGGGGSSGGSSGAGGSCTPGTFQCIGGTSFQQCDNGHWAATQQMAAGTACTEGISADLGIHHASKRTLHKRFHWRRNGLLAF